MYPLKTTLEYTVFKGTTNFYANNFGLFRRKQLKDATGYLNKITKDFKIAKNQSRRKNRRKIQRGDQDKRKLNN